MENLKLTFKIVLTGEEAQNFLRIKELRGRAFMPNTLLLRDSLLDYRRLLENPAALHQALADSAKQDKKKEEKQDATPTKRLADRPTWMEFSKLISTWGDQITPYWDERAAQIYQHGSIMGNETPLQTKRKFDGALRFLEDWDLWMEGEFTPYGETYAEWIQHATPFAENFTPPSLPTLAELEAQHAINQGTHSDAQNS